LIGLESQTESEAKAVIDDVKAAVEGEMPGQRPRSG
jgi:hypothetical protein